jgi:hypothetical protein
MRLYASAKDRLLMTFRARYAATPYLVTSAGSSSNTFCCERVVANKAHPVGKKLHNRCVMSRRRGIRRKSSFVIQDAASQALVSMQL